jgi:diguanylate cyclase (GGDEF)-like protein
MTVFIMQISVFSRSETIDLSAFEAATLGKYLHYFQEKKNSPLSLNEAIDRFSRGDALQGTGNSISLGIGVRPVWLKATVKNEQLNDTLYRLSIETPWLDYIDTWLVQDGLVQKHIVGGDAVPFDQRPMPYRVFAFETRFLPGTTDLYFRIESLGPMAIPLRMSTIDAAIKRDISSAYEYGFLYGVMAALALYNIVLFVIIRQRIFGLYSLYLLGFIVNSLSYTGQLHTLITSDYGPYFQDWTDTFLMITYSIAGLLFARELLNTRSYAPRLDKLTIAVTTIIPLGILVGALANQLVFSLILAFILNSSFALLFIALGVAALKAGADFARLFLFSSVQAAVCIGISTMAVGGVVPYNDFTFKAIEVGMALEAVLLAVIIAQQFRMAQRDKVMAETYARTDPLTGLLNRRGFQEMADKLWENLERNRRNVSIVLLDIDHFKQINDSHGHIKGDEVLIALAECIQRTVRKGDICARWGGEEFILLLPETDREEALIQTERLRQAIETLRVPHKKTTLSITSSFGVSGTPAKTGSATFSGKFRHDYNFEGMVKEADDALYAAKNSGRNQVFFFSDGEFKTAVAVPSAV